MALWRADREMGRTARWETSGKSKKGMRVRSGRDGSKRMASGGISKVGLSITMAWRLLACGGLKGGVASRSPALALGEGRGQFGIGWFPGQYGL